MLPPPVRPSTDTTIEWENTLLLLALVTDKIAWGKSGKTMHHAHDGTGRGLVLKRVKTEEYSIEPNWSTGFHEVKSDEPTLFYGLFHGIF